jgi:hypothetical protein
LLPFVLSPKERISQILHNAGIECSAEELNEVQQNYQVIRDGLDKALASLNLAEEEPDFIRTYVPT